MKHTIEIALSTQKKLFVTDKQASSILIALQLSNTPDAVIVIKTLTVAQDYTCTFNNVDAGTYDIRAYTVDNGGNIFGDEISGTIIVEDGIPAPGQLIVPSTWEVHQKFTVTSLNELRDIEIPVLMHVIVT